jgi:hypothetical protein
MMVLPTFMSRTLSANGGSRRLDEVLKFLTFKVKERR